MATDKKTPKKRFSILPSKKWQFPALLAIGSLIGLGLFTLQHSKATSYLSNDPKACINCHVMTPQYMTWNKSSHREVATCNDCHVPHDNIFNTYYFKAKDGLYHSYVFTTRSEPQVIKAKSASIEVIQENCVRCHIDQVTDPKVEGFAQHHVENRTTRLCWECHKDVPHGKVKSLSSVGFQIEPIDTTDVEGKHIISEWIKKSNEKKKQNNE